MTQEQEGQQQEQQQEGADEEETRQQTALDWLLGDHADAAGGLTLESDDSSDTDAVDATAAGGSVKHSSSSTRATIKSLDFRGLGHELNASELHQLIERYSWNQGNTQLVLAVLVAGLMPNLVHVEYTKKALRLIAARAKSKQAKLAATIYNIHTSTGGLVVTSPADSSVRAHMASTVGRQFVVDR